VKLLVFLAFFGGLCAGITLGAGLSAPKALFEPRLSGY